MPSCFLGAARVAMVADAIRECSNCNGLILDPFGGAGTTMIAAEQTSRRTRLIEIDPLFVKRQHRALAAVDRRPSPSRPERQPFVRSAQ